MLWCNLQGWEFFKRKAFEVLTENGICDNPFDYGEPFLFKLLLTVAKLIGLSFV